MDDEVLHVEVTEVDRIIVFVTGEIDAGSALALRAALSELDPHGHILLDLSGVTFMDCSGLNVILTQRTKMNDAGGSIHVRHPSHAVRRILNVTELTGLLRKSDDR